MESCPVVFAKLAKELGAARFAEYVNRFHLLDKPNLPFGDDGTCGGQMTPLGPGNGSAELVRAALGRGEVLLTPYAVAGLTLAIARGGRCVEPYIVKQIKSRRGKIVKQGSATELGARAGGGRSSSRGRPRSWERR